MAALKRVFGTKSQKEVTSQQANQTLQEAESTLLKKQAFLEKKVDEEIDKARKYGKKNQKAAIECLKRSKRYKKQLQQIDGVLMTIQGQKMALDDAYMNKSMLEAMATANKAMKGIHKNLNVDKVQDMMDDITEQQDIAREIAEAISKPSGAVDYDEDELLEELELLEEEAVKGQLLDVSGVDLPSVPTGEPIAASKSYHKAAEEDEDLSKLMAWSN
uniref:Charged multivesicular body protein 4b n=1 Tax=Schistocephalus solidus TaxID=70667 RepID=A0A0V0J8A8_SCHSO